MIELTTTPTREHNALQWAKVRKRAICLQTTVDDWENASDFQRQVIHQIELALLSLEDQEIVTDLTKLQ